MSEGFTDNNIQTEGLDVDRLLSEDTIVLLWEQD